MFAGALAGDGAAETAVLGGSTTMGTAAGTVAAFGVGVVVVAASACILAKTPVIGILAAALYAAGAEAAT